MITKRIKYSIVLIVMFFSFVNLAHANVVINEVQISPTEGRFIELYNNGSSSIDLTNWYIQRKTATGTFTSLVTKPNFEGKTIEGNSYFVISKSSNINADIIFDSLTLTESNTIQIKDTDGVVVDKVGWGETNDCVSPCVGNPTSGQSISRISSNNFVVSSPTPNEANSDSSNNNTSSPSVDAGDANAPVSSSSNSKITPIIVYKPTTKIIAPKIVTAGIPFILEQITTGTKKELVTVGRFIWNFGDGMKKEISNSDPFEYSYEYPGDYVLSLSYSDTTFDIKPDAMDRVTIKVVPSGVTISSVGNYSDPYVEIENHSSYEISLNKWILRGSVHAFLMPEGMVILPNKKLKLSPKITGFDINDLSYISILDTAGQTFATYPNRNSYSTKYTANKNANENIVKADAVSADQINSVDKSSNVINLNDLGASAASANNSSNNNLYIYFGLAGIILVGIIGVIFLRHKKDYPDYVEKGLSASDMTIIE